MPKPGDIVFITTEGRLAFYAVDGFWVHEANPHIPIPDLFRQGSEDIVPMKTPLLVLGLRKKKPSYNGNERYDLKILHGERRFSLNVAVPLGKQLDDLLLINQMPEK